MATIEQFNKWFAPYSYKATIKENGMSDFKKLEIEGTIKSIKDYDNRRVISIGPYVGKTAIAAWFNKFEGEDAKEALMGLGAGNTVKLFGYQTKDGWNNATGFELLTDVNADMQEPDNGRPAPTSSPTPDDRKLSDMMLCNVTNNGSMIFCEYAKNANILAEVDNDVLTNLFDTIADWHRKNAG